MLTDTEMQILMEQTEKYGKLTDNELMKLVTQYAIANTGPLSEDRAMLVAAAMRLDK
jgi:hypothetical protein